MALAIDTGGTFTVITRPANADADATTNWTAVKLEGTGGGPTATGSVGSTDLFVQGTDAVEAVTNRQRVVLRWSISGGLDFTSGSTGTGGTAVPDGNIYIWAVFLAAGSLLTEANGGMQIELGDGTAFNYWNQAGSDNYTGGFVKWAIHVDTSTRFTTDDSGGTVDIGDITTIGFVTDVGGTTTRFDNFVVDAIDIGDGLSFNGTTTGDKLFQESAAVDATTAIGILKDDNGIIFSQGNLEYTAASQTSDGETLVFTETLNLSTYTYTLNFTNNQQLVNSSVLAVGGVAVNLDTGSNTGFSMTGGAVTGPGTNSFAASQTISGVVFTDRGTTTTSAPLVGGAFNGCDAVTLTGTTTATSVTFDESTDTNAAVITQDIDNLIGCSWVRGTGNHHAVEQTTANDFTWDPNSISGYGAAGSTGTNVGITGGSITGTEEVYVSATTGTCTVTVAAGQQVPKVASAGAQINVQQQQTTFQFTVSPLPSPDYEWRLYTVTAVGSLAGEAEVAGAENETAATPGVYNHSFSSQPAALQIISNDYVEFTKYYTLTSADINDTITLEIDDND